MSEAALAFAGAAQLDPGLRDVKRTQLSFYLAAGLTTEATIAGGELLHRFPDDQDAAEAVLHLLNHRLDTIATHFSIPIASRHRAGSDALATAEIFILLITELEEAHGIKDLGAARRFQFPELATNLHESARIEFLLFVFIRADSRLIRNEQS